MSTFGLDLTSCSILATVIYINPWSNNFTTTLMSQCRCIYPPILEIYFFVRYECELLVQAALAESYYFIIFLLERSLPKLHLWKTHRINGKLISNFFFLEILIMWKPHKAKCETPSPTLLYLGQIYLKKYSFFT